MKLFPTSADGLPCSLQKPCRSQHQNTSRQERYGELSLRSRTEKLQLIWLIWNLTSIDFIPTQMSKLEWKKHPEICMQRLRDVVSSLIIRQSIWYWVKTLNPKPLQETSLSWNWWRYHKYMAIYLTLTCSQANWAAQKYEWISYCFHGRLERTRGGARTIILMDLM